MQEIIIEKMSYEEAQKKEIFSWPIWEKEVSVFNWEYDSDEHCYLIEGEVVVRVEGKDYTITKGDYVIFKKGLKCVWDIKADIKKHFFFT